jgi:hypothetical protein
MMHVPNNLHAPALARQYHRMLQRKLAGTSESAGELAPFPAERARSADAQLSLFG